MERKEDRADLNYGVIGNCRSAALVSARGSIDWCCLPDFDSPSLFASILDTKIGGSFRFEVSDAYQISQSYFYRTNILRTEFRSAEAAFEVIDFMPRYKTGEKEYYDPAELYRYLRPLYGTPELIVHYEPALNYARDEVVHVIEDNYIRSYSKRQKRECVYLYSNLPLSDILEKQPIRLDEQAWLLLSYNQKLVPIDIFRVYLEYQRTKVYWLNWTNRSRTFTEYNEQIIRSLLVLKAMTFNATGAMLAALTTSIPETIGEVRNWDYRFCWLRDASMSIDTLLRMEHYHAAKRFLGYIKGIIKSKHDAFQIMYGIRRERELQEFDLPHLAGYENSKPVRIGNAAYTQNQHDVFGYVMNVIYKYFKFFPGTLDEIEDMWEIVRNIMRSVASQWEKPDRGIWEIRNEEKHFVLSKVMSWVAFDRGAKIAGLLQKKYYADTWRERANTVKADVMAHGWKEDLQTFTQTYCNRELDASLLLMAHYGFIPAEDERFVKTVKAIKRELFYNGLMYRYVARDDFGKPTSSFTICTFWLIEALFRIGQKEEARTLFNQLLSYGNHLGLFSEDIDFESKRLLGNFPQAYSHLALINTAALLSEQKQGTRFIKP